MDIQSPRGCACPDGYPTTGYTTGQGALFAAFTPYLIHVEPCPYAKGLRLVGGKLVAYRDGIPLW